MDRLHSLVTAEGDACGEEMSQADCRLHSDFVGVQTETASGHPGWLVDGPNTELPLKVLCWRGVAGTDGDRQKALIKTNDSDWLTM